MIKLRKKAGLYVLLLDCLVVLLSLTSAWIIRAQFSLFLFDLEKFLIVLPYAIVIRILVNAFFEHYSLSFVNLQLGDIVAIFKHSGVPSAIFLVVRLVSPIRLIRMPLSMIALEYLFTVTGMILVRIIFVRIGYRRNDMSAAAGGRKAIVIGRTAHLKPSELSEIMEKQHLEITGILSPDPLEWNMDCQGIRVFGGYDSMDELLFTNDAVSLALIEQETTHREKLLLLEKSRENSLQPVKLSKGKLHTFDLIEALPVDPPDIEKVPEEVFDALTDESIALLGHESALCNQLLSLCTSRNISAVAYSMFTRHDEGLDLNGVRTLIDLKYLALDERMLLKEEAVDDCLAYLGSVEDHLEKIGYGGTCLLVTPARGDATKRLLKRWRNVSVLVTGGLITNELLYAGRHLPEDGLWESPQEIAGFVFKAIHLAKSGNRHFYAGSDNAVSREDIKTARRLVSSVAVLTERQHGVPHSTPRQSWGLKELPLIDTSYYGLFEIKHWETELL